MASLAPEQDITRFVTEAAERAPSVSNTQPWWFTGGETQFSVHVDVKRRLATADPAGRESVISCGAALFCARLAVRHLGYDPRVTLFPDPDIPTLVARVQWERALPATEPERALFAQLPNRHTHRGGFSGDPLPPELITLLREDARREGAIVEMVASPQRLALLSAVVDAGEMALRLDPGRSGEQAHWAPPPGSHRHDGVPTTGYPARPAHTEPPFPDRDFARGHGWGVPSPGPGQPASHPGTVCLLATATDTPVAWVAAGQALQRMLLSAASHGVSAAIHSQPVEFPELRDFIQRRLSGGFPHLVLRFGATSQVFASVRRPAEDVMFRTHC